MLCGCRLPRVGDVVEYPLRSIETEDFADGRSHGVGLLVGRNMDRGDAAKLPRDQLPICEIEPLRQEEPESQRWILSHTPGYIQLYALGCPGHSWYGG